MSGRVACGPVARKAVVAKMESCVDVCVCKQRERSVRVRDETLQKIKEDGDATWSPPDHVPFAFRTCDGGHSLRQVMVAAVYPNAAAAHP